MDTNIQALLKVGKAQGWKILVFLSKASQSMDAAGKLQDQSIESSIIKKKNTCMHMWTWPRKLALGSNISKPSLITIRSLETPNKKPDMFR